MKLLKNKQQEPSQNAKICCISREKLEDKYPKDKKYPKRRIIAWHSIQHMYIAYVMLHAANNICNLKYRIPRKSTVDQTMDQIMIIVLS